MWLWTCRTGFERDLVEELPRARVLAPALVAGEALPPGSPAPTFGRQGFAVTAELGPDPNEVGEALAALVPPGQPFALHVWVPDSEQGNRLSGQASQLAEAVAAVLDAARPGLVGEAQLLGASDPIAQVCLAGAGNAYLGAVARGQAASTWPGGRARMKLPAGAPSRSAAKLAEALGWIGFGPEDGDVCVDLGAAPGGWTWLCARRRARVIAVDRAGLAPALARDRHVMHVRDNAFRFRPAERCDWLLCDMVHKPGEVVRLLSAWGRRSDARYLLANLKLPMKRRVHEVASARRELGNAGWRDLRTRQLYHDRDEITLFARR